MRLTQILIFTGFVLVFSACSSSKSTVEQQQDSEIPEAFIGKLLVSLTPDVEVSELVDDFSKYELKHLSLARASDNQHLFSYNPEKISGEDLLKKLNRSKKVNLAEALSERMTKATLMESSQEKPPAVK